MARKTTSLIMFSSTAGVRSTAARRGIARDSTGSRGSRTGGVPTDDSIDRIPQSQVRIVGVLLLIIGGAAAAAAPARFIRFGEARPILAELVGKLPPELDTLTPAQMEAAWPAWIERHDRDVRARLEQGDEDTIVN
jgi:hypothetical protein